MSGRISSPFTAGERQLLDRLQHAFPLHSRPYGEMARVLWRKEDEVIGAVAGWLKEGVIRYLGPIFEPLALGYHSALCALRVTADRVQEAAKIINAHPGVTHNYLRDGEYNFWFTLTVPREEPVEGHLQRLTRGLSGPALFLPARRLFKIGVVLPLDGAFSPRWSGERLEENDRPLDLTPADRRAVRAVQSGLAAETAPYAAAAAAAGLSEEELLETLSRLQRQGGVRRIGAVLRPTRAGFPVNAMVVWRAEPSELSRLGRFFAQVRLVTHCYERATAEAWPYNLYTMVHFPEEKGLVAWLAQMREKTGIQEFLVLKTVRELKKVRMQYFLEERPPSGAEGE